MNARLIGELLNAYQFCLSDGMEHAIRVFPQHREWLLAQKGKEFREVEYQLHHPPIPKVAPKEKIKVH